MEGCLVILSIRLFHWFVAFVEQLQQAVLTFHVLQGHYQRTILVHWWDTNTLLILCRNLTIDVCKGCWIDLNTVFMSWIPCADQLQRARFSRFSTEIILRSIPHRVYLFVKMYLRRIRLCNWGREFERWVLVRIHLRRNIISDLQRCDRHCRFKRFSTFFCLQPVDNRILVQTWLCYKRILSIEIESCYLWKVGITIAEEERKVVWFLAFRLEEVTVCLCWCKRIKHHIIWEEVGVRHLFDILDMQGVNP